MLTHENYEILNIGQSSDVASQEDDYHLMFEACNKEVNFYDSRQQAL